MGNQTFYGRGAGYAVDTTKPMTVVTQFITDDGTDLGKLIEIRRFYVQDGVHIHTPQTTILGEKAVDSITDGFCEDKKKLFGDINDHKLKGGLEAMGDSLDRGHVMALSLWDDVEVNMLWLDSCFPLDKSCSDPGVHRGSCPGGENSSPSFLRREYPNSWTSFANAAIGEIGSTLQPSPTPVPTPAPSGCFPSNGMNQPECLGQSEQRCKFMMEYERKCQWVSHETPKPTPAPTSLVTPSPTPAPSTIAVCKEWCSQGDKEWAKKCTWAGCAGCDVCQSISTTSPTLTPTPAPTPIATPVPTPSPTLVPTTSGQCKPWCSENRADWDKKCIWTSCAACSACELTFTPAPTQNSGPCRPWCNECPMDWATKCTWDKLCGACSACTFDGKRRLRGSQGDDNFI